MRIADDNVGSGGFDLDAIEAVVINTPALVLQGRTIIDSPPGGNADGKLDPGETADLVVELKNVGRVGVSGLTGTLRTDDTMLAILDSTGTFGELLPDSTRRNSADRFRVSADAATPREHPARMVLHLAGTDYADSLFFTIIVGELRAVDPIPDNAAPARYWAYDDGDSGYVQAPEFDWFDITGVGTRLGITGDDQTVQLDLPPAFGPFYFYGRRFTRLSVCGNGWVAAGQTTRTLYRNEELPSTSQPSMLALLWDDLYPPTSGGIWSYHDEANHRLIIQYDSMPYWSNQSIYDWHQLVIYDTTLAAPDGNSVFTYQYLTANNYGSTTVGINDSTTATGIQVLHDGAYHRGALPIVPGRAIKFTTVEPLVGVTEPQGPPGLGPAARPGLRVERNPFTGAAAVSYSLAASGPVRLEVYDNSGRRVRSLVCAELGPGEYRLSWPGTDDKDRRLAAGIYWLRLESAAGTQSGKLVKLD